MKQNYRDQLYRLPARTGNNATRNDAWLSRHAAAVACPQDGLEKAFVEMLSGWLRYADAHRGAYESGIGDDGVLGPHWAQIGSGLRGLLNGSLGRLDGGTLDGLLCRTLHGEEFDPDTL